MAVSNFAAQTREHNLASGRVVEVREDLPFMQIVRAFRAVDVPGGEDIIAAMASGETIGRANAAAGLALSDVVVRELVVTPRVLLHEFDVEGESADYGSEWCWIDDFTDDEHAELMDLGLAGGARATRFPGDGAVNDDRADGEGVGDDAKPAPRPKKRKS